MYFWLKFRNLMVFCSIYYVFLSLGHLVIFCTGKYLSVFRATDKKLQRFSIYKLEINKEPDRKKILSETGNANEKQLMKLVAMNENRISIENHPGKQLCIKLKLIFGTTVQKENEDSISLCLFSFFFLKFVVTV